METAHDTYQLASLDRPASGNATVVCAAFLGAGHLHNESVAQLKKMLRLSAQLSSAR